MPAAAPERVLSLVDAACRLIGFFPTPIPRLNVFQENQLRNLCIEALLSDSMQSPLAFIIAGLGSAVLPVEGETC